MKKILVIIICLALSGFLLEIVNRVILSKQMNLPITFDTRELIYPSLYQKFKNYNSSKINVLLLGGSTVKWTEEGGFFDETMQDPSYVFYDVAEPAYTSLDSFYEYEYLISKGYVFDYVIFYNSINDVRFNNVPPEKFSEQYDFNMFYQLANSVFRHDFIGNTVMRTSLGFTGLKTYLLFSNERIQQFIPLDLISKSRPEWLQYGSDIKTEKSYRININKIVQLASHAKSTLVVPLFAYYLPENYSEELFKNNALGYDNSPPGGVPIDIWGEPKNVAKGLQVHNDILRELAPKYEFVDTTNISTMSANFRDVCHFSEKGKEKFAQLLVDTIRQIQNKKSDQ